MKALGILLLLTLLENSFTFPKPDKKKKDNWKEIAKDALCDSRDSAGVMEALKESVVTNYYSTIQIVGTKLWKLVFFSIILKKKRIYSVYFMHTVPAAQVRTGIPH